MGTRLSQGFAGGAHAERLTRKGTFSKKVLLTQDSDRSLLAVFRDHGEFYLPRLDIKHCIRVISLRKDALLLGKSTINFLPALMVARKIWGQKSFFF